MPRSKIDIQVVNTDALAFGADILVMKHAQGLYGVDRAAFERLAERPWRSSLPQPGGHLIGATNETFGSPLALFIGVVSLYDFGYAEIRGFGMRALSILSEEKMDLRHIALTIHGPGYGLDEAEAFKAELAGVLDAIVAGDFPRNLALISFVELNPRRAQRLSGILSEIVPEGHVETSGLGPLSALGREARSSLRTAGQGSASKPSVFVAMPFTPEMDDLFHYGIKGATDAAGLLAERADLSAFTGDIMAWVKNRISTATLVVADISSANPNVFLEIGYAWGRGVATVLLAHVSSGLKFDVSGQRCIRYEYIKDLEQKLTHELRELMRMQL